MTTKYIISDSDQKWYITEATPKNKWTYAEAVDYVKNTVKEVPSKSHLKYCDQGNENQPRAIHEHMYVLLQKIYYVIILQNKFFKQNLQTLIIEPLGAIFESSEGYGIDGATTNYTLKIRTPASLQKDANYLNEECLLMLETKIHHNSINFRTYSNAINHLWYDKEESMICMSTDASKLNNLSTFAQFYGMFFSIHEVVKVLSKMVTNPHNGLSTTDSYWQPKKLVFDSPEQKNHQEDADTEVKEIDLDGLSSKETAIYKIDDTDFDFIDNFGKDVPTAQQEAPPIQKEKTPEKTNVFVSDDEEEEIVIEAPKKETPKKEIVIETPKKDPEPERIMTPKIDSPKVVVKKTIKEIYESYKNKKNASKDKIMKRVISKKFKCSIEEKKVDKKCYFEDDTKSNYCLHIDKNNYHLCNKCGTSIQPFVEDVIIEEAETLTHLKNLFE